MANILRKVELKLVKMLPRQFERDAEVDSGKMGEEILYCRWDHRCSRSKKKRKMPVNGLQLPGEARHSAFVAMRPEDCD